MEVTLSISTLFQLFAALNAALLGVAAICQKAATRSSIPRVAGASLLFAASVIVVISMEHAGYLTGATYWTLVESSLTLYAGPVLIALILTFLGRPIPSLALFVPPAVYVSVVSLLVGADHGFLSVSSAVLIQFTYTAVAWGIVAVLHRPTEAVRIAPKREKAAIYTLIAMTAVHLAQTVRLVEPDLEFTRNIVPVVAGMLFLLLTAAVVRVAMPVSSTFDSLRGSLDAERDTAILGKLENLLEDHGLHLHRDLRLPQAAARVGVPVNDLSHAINRSAGTSFSTYMSRARVRTAKQLLCDWDERRTSVEAIGLMSGFHSRSVFYRAFREETGMSPAQFRHKRLADSN